MKPIEKHAFVKEKGLQQGETYLPRRHHMGLKKRKEGLWGAVREAGNLSIRVGERGGRTGELS